MHFIDLDLKYCPQCDEEYREEMSTCATCRVPLLSGGEKQAMVEAQRSKMASRSMEISSDDELVNIRKGPLGEMKHLQALLATECIPALLAGEKGSCGTGCGGCGDFNLQIKVGDAQEVSEVLTREFKRTTALDSHDLRNTHAVFDTGVASSTCPACGFGFSTSEAACPDCGLCF